MSASKLLGQLGNDLIVGDVRILEISTDVASDLLAGKTLRS